MFSFVIYILLHIINSGAFQWKMSIENVEFRLLHSYVKNTPEMILKIDRAHLGDGNPRVVNPETGAFLGLF